MSGGNVRPSWQIEMKANRLSMPTLIKSSRDLPYLIQKRREKTDRYI